MSSPLVCLVDDAQWLDRASAQTLAFAARRLLAEPVALVVAARPGGEGHDWAGLPELAVEGLSAFDARALLDSALRAPLDDAVCDRIVAETRGNPLALLELPRGQTPAELAGGFGAPDGLALSERIEGSFRRRLARLPVETQRLLLVAAAEPVGEPLLVWRAAERLGIDPVAAEPAADLLGFGARVRFRHPLVRSAVYGAASAQERRRVHAALAEVTDAEADPDRRAWHRAHASPAPDERVAAELERSADRAQARGGLAASAAFLERATELTPEPVPRGARALAAAEAKHLAEAPDAALRLLAVAEITALDELRCARAELLRARIAFASSRGSDAPPLLLTAAKRLEGLDVSLARGTYLEALSASLFAGRLASRGDIVDVAHAARRAPPPPARPSASDLLLDGLAGLITDGYVAGAPMLKRALLAFRRGQASVEEGLRWLWLACHVAELLWDHESWDALSARFVQQAVDAGALTLLPVALTNRAGMHIFAGELVAAASLVAEAEAIADAIGTEGPSYAAVAVTALRGPEQAAVELLDGTAEAVTARGEGLGLTFVRWVSALRSNSVGRHQASIESARLASEDPQVLWFSTCACVELVEAAARCGAGARRRRPRPAIGVHARQ